MRVKAKKDLYNGGKCFTKGRVYEVCGYYQTSTAAGLMEAHVINDLGERHLIGSWWRDFSIVS